VEKERPGDALSGKEKSSAYGELRHLARGEDQRGVEMAGEKKGGGIFPA